MNRDFFLTSHLIDYLAHIHIGKIFIYPAATFFIYFSKMPQNTLRVQAENKLKIADHLLSTTFNIVKDPKLLISVVDTLYQAMDLAIDAMMEFEAHYKKPDYRPEEKIEIFRRKVVSKHGLDPAIVDFYFELKNTVESHRKSGVEFTKKNAFVITDDDYNLKTLKYDDIKGKYAKARAYSQQMFDIIKKLD